ncbi:MAG: RNA polymerase sigma factor [Ignavibacteriales bacterium]|nr:RNA polymerase sigma factor [Ignavibacteriales bacterium]
MIQVRDGELHKLALLFERHHVALYNYYVRQTSDRDLSEDFVQEVFLRIMKYRHTFRGEGEFLPWMYHIARNVQIDHARKWGRETKYDEETHDQISDDPIPDDHVEQLQKVGMLQKALAKLSPEKREVLILSRYQEMKYSAIAELLGCTVEVVKVRVHRAMNDLRKYYFQLAGE